MRKFLACLAVVCPLAFAELTTEQKISDFKQIAAMYAKHYAPYEWKQQYAKFNLLDIEPWLASVAATKTDLEFYDVVISYAASLNDGHVTLTLPSDFFAYLGFRVDLFDNRPVIYGVSRQMLPAARYDVNVGDEVVSIDGVLADDLIRRFAKYSIAANNRSTARMAADLLPLRPQVLDPTSVDLKETATVVLRDPAGAQKTIVIPWVKTGLPLTSIGPSPVMKSDKLTSSTTGFRGLPPDPDEPAYMAFRRQIASAWKPSYHPFSVAGMSALQPIQRMPANFQQRLGRSASGIGDDPGRPSRAAAGGRPSSAR